MSEVIAALHASFDHVVIDSPPIALYPDGLAIASKVDGVLLVVKASTTPRDAVRDSKRLLASRRRQGLRGGAEPRAARSTRSTTATLAITPRRAHPERRARASTDGRGVREYGRSLPGRRLGATLSLLTGLQILASLALAGVPDHAPRRRRRNRRVLRRRHPVAGDRGHRHRHAGGVLVPLLAHKHRGGAPFERLVVVPWRPFRASRALALLLAAAAPIIATAIVPGFTPEGKALTAQLYPDPPARDGRHRLHVDPHVHLSDSASLSVATDVGTGGIAGCRSRWSS